jgi:predicted house-cleaning noncanonical NTP pyrophosphatase (MazG superfamily)
MEFNKNGAYLIKLVRDQVHQSLGGGEGSLEYGKVPTDQHQPLLRRKLFEEVSEYCEDPSLEELADLVEVISALSETAHSSSLQEVIRIAQAKKKLKGGFEGATGMYSSYTSDND